MSAQPESRQSTSRSAPILMIKSGPANPDLPHRYGCGCGAIWNASAPLALDTVKNLCGPHCAPRLFVLKEGS